MRIALALMTAAGGMLGGAALAQTTMAPPPPPPPVHGGGMMRADADHDGVITRAEMIANAEARFAAMDADKDGKVSAAERDAARDAMQARRRGGGGYGMRGDPDGDVALTRAVVVDRAGKRFDRLDTNRDGKLDAAERAAARPKRGARRIGAMTPPSAAD